MEYQRDEHRIHLIAYHLAWVTKRRHKVLTGEIAKSCRSLIQNRCAERGWTVLNLEVSPDRVWLFVRAWPSDSAFEIIKDCKALTSNALRSKYKILLKLPSLWTRSYFASTEECVRPVTIAHYVEAQSRS